jgi:hypothetical protein
VVIVVGIIARLVLAVVLGLGVDESYEVVMSRALSLGYFDHPPLSFWIPGMLARLAGSENRLLLRLPFILLFAGTTILMYRLTARTYGDRAGLVAALLLNVSPVFSLSTGGWILPDGPLDFAILATTLCLTHAILEDTDSWRWWIAAGGCAGVALLSKYHGAFLLLGTLLFLATRGESRAWLRRPEPYVAAVLAIALASPALIWNARHDFASVRFQAGRAASHGLHLDSLARNIGGQMGYLLPWLWLPLVVQLVRGVRLGPRDAPRWLLTCLAIGPIALFTLVSLGGNPGLPHWPAPGYLLLFPLVGAAVAGYEAKGSREERITRRLLLSATVAFFVLVVIAASDVATGWMTRLAPSLFRRGDPSLEAVDWRELKTELSARGELLPNDIIVTTHWIDGAKAGYALGPDHAVLCLGDDPRGFRFAYPPAAYAGRDALLLVRTGRDSKPIDIVSRYSRFFRSIEPLDMVAIRRAGQVEFGVAVFRGRELTPDVESSGEATRER